MLQKYYKNITFILNISIYIDFFSKKDKIIKELELYCRIFKKEKNTSIISLYFAKYNNGINKKRRRIKCQAV